MAAFHDPSAYRALPDGEGEFGEGLPGPRPDDGGAGDPATAIEHQPGEPAGLVFGDRPVHLVAAAGAHDVARSVDGRADGGDLGLVKVTRGGWADYNASITNALDAGVPPRDAQILARHADPRTTEHYDRARGNLDRHGVHFLTAYVAGA